MTTEKNKLPLSVVYKPLSSLLVYARNARTHSAEQVSQIVASMREYGWTNPVLTDEKGEVIAGHGRLLAAEQLSIDEVPTITLSGLSEQQKKAYRLADNKLSLNAGWDTELLKLEFADLLDSEFDISLTGFSLEEIDDLLHEPDVPENEEPYTAKIDTPVYEPSDVVPEITELYDQGKTAELKSRIEAAGLPAEVETFLMCAAERHTVFHFNRIADYYASADAELQELFEESALVIIDYEKAIEHGFVHLTKQMVEIVHGQKEDDYA